MSLLSAKREKKSSNLFQFLAVNAVECLGNNYLQIIITIS